MKYTSKRNKSSDDHGRKVFIFTCIFAIAFAIAFFAIQPPSYGDLICSENTGKGCGCPANPNEIRLRNVLIVDTTDPLRKGKYEDIERLVTSVGTTPLPLAEWLSNGKKTDMTSVFVLSDTPVADMQPIAKFCAPPPLLAQYVGFKGREIQELIKSTTERAQNAITKVKDSSTANQSAIVESLSTIVKSSSHWTPGSTLILASDLIENSKECGWFEKAGTIPPLKSVPAVCQSMIRQFQEGLRPNETYKGASTVALCTLPGKDTKPGLHAFWSEMVQGAMGSDALYTCDPTVIHSRRAFLNERTK